MWRTSCCVPEVWYHKGHFQRLNEIPPMDKARTRQDGWDKTTKGKNRSRSHANRGEDSRSEERRKEKREGAGEAVKVQSYTKIFINVHCIVSCEVMLLC